MKNVLPRRAAIIGTVILALAMAACDAASDEQTAQTTASPSAAATPSASATAAASPTDGDDDDSAGGEETSVFDLEVGDCFSATGDEVESVTVVDCDEPHIYEVFAVFDHEAGEDEPYPGDDALLEYADSECQPHFEDYVGADYETSVYWITSVTPSEQTWDDDDREIVCTLKLGEQGEETTGSAEGSGE
jgi:hypothetical protein